MSNLPKGANSILLVVDDESSVCRAVVRLLKGKAGEILTACTPSEAETILQTRLVTHLLCDQRLGPGQPTGLDLALRWKHQFTSIERIVILTGADLDQIDVPDGIDHILPKITDPKELSTILGLDDV